MDSDINSKEITIDQFTKNVDAILVDENKDCKADLLALRIFGGAMVASVAVLLLLYNTGLSAPIRAMLMITMLFAYQAVYILASIIVRMARKMAAVVSILAVFTSMYQEMNANAIKQFFESVYSGSDIYEN
jgi:hypothetical protein